MSGTLPAAGGAGLLEPRLLAAVSDLRLVARRALPGILSGEHAGLLKGPGLEFSQYRNYEPGDDLRQVDWKLLARSDRYFVREAHRESQLELWLLVDLSASMGQPCSAVAGWTRLDCARSLLACLAWLGNLQGDAVALLGLAEDGLTYIPPRRGDRQVDRLCVQLARLRAGAGWPSDRVIDALWRRLRRPALVVLVSDFLERDREIGGLATKLAAAGMDTIAIELSLAEERTFPFTGRLGFVDVETGRRLETDAGTVARGYRRAYAADRKRLRGQLAAAGVEHVEMAVEAPLDDALRRFLTLRARRNL